MMNDWWELSGNPRYIAYWYIEVRHSFTDKKQRVTVRIPTRHPYTVQMLQRRLARGAFVPGEVVQRLHAVLTANRRQEKNDRC